VTPAQHSGPPDPPGIGRAGPHGRKRIPYVALATIVFTVSVAAGVLVGTLRGSSGDAQVAAASTCVNETLHVYATPDIAGVLSDLLPGYQRRSESDCDAVQVISDSSADVVDNLTSGWNDRAYGPPPDVWIAEATSWLQILRSDEEGGQLAPERAPSVARSPTVLAMPRPMAEALGWPQAQLAWADLADLVSEPEGWAAHGHSEWGPFQFGLTTPRRSTAAAHAIISVGAALGGVWADELSTEGVAQEQVRLNLLQLQRAVARTDGTTLEQLAGLRRADDSGAGLDFLSAFPIEERHVWRYNAGLPAGTSDDDVRQAPPEVPLAAWYPAEGSLALDYPYVLLNAPWVDERTRRQANDFLAMLQSPRTQERLRALGFRGADGQVGEVLDDVEGVSPNRAGEQIAPPAPGVLTTVLDTWDTLSRRTNTLAVIDVSGSMVEPASGASATRLDVATLAATEAVSLSADDSGFGLWEFSTDLDGRRDHRELVPLGPLGENIGAITRRQAVEEALRGMEPTADTALYETLLAAYREAKRNFDPEGVNNVVLLTDGDQDNPGGELSLAELKAELSDLMDPEEPIGLIAIGYGEQADLHSLEELSDLVGGEAYGAERTSDITRIILQALTN
jgi:Ca-activated chloride channel family protein